MSTGPAPDATATRADRLIDLLAERELDALLVTNLINVRYLTGFTGTNAVAIMGPEVRTFLTDFRYTEQAERQVTAFDRVKGERDLLGDATERLAQAGASRVGFEDHDLTVRRHGRVRERLADEIELVAAGLLVEELRAVKDAGEVAAIRAAASLTTAVLEELRDQGFGRRTEREVAGDLEREMRARGAEPAFPTIVAAGANGALPHAVPGDDPIPPDALVVVDLGCALDGYCSDCTRTLATGTPSPEAREVYKLVRQTQEQALTATVAGAGCREVDAAARAAIAAAGHGERFGHGLGHGVGLEVHEGPRLSQGAGESEQLEAGNVITVEPGVYVPGELGVRIEDLVVVDDEGPQVLTPFTKELLTLD
jgi:Xaa-Pro aminopeptidase